MKSRHERSGPVMVICVLHQLGIAHLSYFHLFSSQTRAWQEPGSDKGCRR